MSQPCRATRRSWPWRDPKGRMQSPRQLWRSRRPRHRRRPPRRWPRSARPCTRCSTWYRPATPASSRGSRGTSFRQHPGDAHVTVSPHLLNEREPKTLSPDREVAVRPHSNSGIVPGDQPGLADLAEPIDPELIGSIDVRIVAPPPRGPLGDVLDVLPEIVERPAGLAPKFDALIERLACSIPAFARQIRYRRLPRPAAPSARSMDRRARPRRSCATPSPIGHPRATRACRRRRTRGG